MATLQVVELVTLGCGTCVGTLPGKMFHRNRVRGGCGGGGLNLRSALRRHLWSPSAGQAVKVLCGCRGGANPEAENTVPGRSDRFPIEGGFLGGRVTVGAENIIGSKIERAGVRCGGPTGGFTRRHRKQRPREEGSGTGPQPSPLFLVA
ncbi:hypothetical protein BHM03_00018977 [Ensete ventricosum]|nr:hypothetical protein BHM03_00018977 [Ensete ventricosum]